MFELYIPDKMKRTLRSAFLAIIFISLTQCSSDDARQNQFSAFIGTWELAHYESGQITTSFESEGKLHTITQSITAHDLDYQIIFSPDNKVISRGSFQLLYEFKLKDKTHKQSIPVNKATLGKSFFSGTYTEKNKELLIKNAKDLVLQQASIISMTPKEIVLESRVEDMPFIDLINNPVSLKGAEIRGVIRIVLKRMQ